MRAHALLRKQTERTFATATLAMPRSAQEPTEEIELAPLIVQEVRHETDGTALHGAFGQVIVSEDGSWSVDVENPVVYSSRTRVLLGGRSHTQHTYVWFHRACASRHEGSGRPRAQGVRMTLGTDGFPIIWEALPTPPMSGVGESHLRAIYISRSFEQAALARFGPPQPTCRFAAEYPPGRATEVSIVRVLEDGPIPLGPYVYEANDFAITTLLCRCSSQQVDRFLETSYYDLRPMDELRPLVQLLEDAVKPWVNPHSKSSKRSLLPLDQAIRWPYTAGHD